MPNVQDFHDLFCVTVNNYIWRHDKFARSLQLTGAAKAGKGSELFYAFDDRLGHFASGCGIVFPNAVNGSFELI